MENIDAENFSCTPTASRNSVNTEYWSLHGVDSNLGLFSATLYLIFITLGLPWNSLLFVAVIKHKLYQQPFILLLLNVVLTDLLFLIFILPLLMVTGFSGEYILGDTDWGRCQICSLTIFILSSTYNSLFIIAIMSIDRFLYIYKPLQYDRLISKIWILVPICITWPVCIAIGVISVLVDVKSVNFEAQFLSCTVSQKHSYFGLVLMFLGIMALAVIVVCNAWIIHIVQKNIRVIYASRYSSNREGTSENRSIKKIRNKKQLHLFHTFGMLLLSSLITWIPYISMIIAVRVNQVPLNHTVNALILVLFFSQSMIHPCIFTTFVPDVKDSMKKMIAPYLLKKSPNRETSHSKQSCCDSFFLYEVINEAFLSSTGYDS